MKHTQGTALPWLHIRLRDVALERPSQDFLLGDFDGELFDLLLRNEVQPADLPFLRRADHLGLVVDGKKFADPAEREAERQNLIYLVQQLLKDRDASPPALMLVVTKLDLIDAVEDEQEQRRTEEAINHVHEGLRDLAATEVPQVRLAVRSETDRFPLGHGLEDLLELLTVRPATRLATAPPAVSGTHPLAEFHA
jgi:Double-GTPase 2